MNTSLVTTIGIALATVGLCATAQEYPNRPVKIVTAYAPGGASDILARTVAVKLSDAWGKQVLVENRPGGSGVVGTEFVKGAPPDGYTLQIGTTTTHVINPITLPTAKFDPLKDFAPISPIAIAPYLLAVHPSTKVKTTAELIALAKTNPGKLNYGSSGTSIYLGTELFKSMAGIDMVHIPYKGGGPALTALLANEVQVVFDPLPSAAFGHAKQGALVLLATSGAKRPRAAPDLPTVAESGLPGFDVSSWYGVFAPAGTPRAVVDRVAAEIARAVEQPDVQAKLADLGADPYPMNPDAFAQLVRRDQEMWQKLIQEKQLKIVY
jgi:tripartite-type tricarboxylate transporter receptor subunit TctC